MMAVIVLFMTGISDSCRLDLVRKLLLTQEDAASRQRRHGPRREREIEDWM